MLSGICAMLVRISKIPQRSLETVHSCQLHNISIAAPEMIKEYGWSTGKSGIVFPRFF
jgi:hypothetical protein